MPKELDSPEKTAVSSPKKDKKKEVKPSSGSNSSSSASSSTSSSDSHKDSNVGELDTAEWFYQNPHGKKALLHWVHFLTEDGSKVPYCRNSPFAQAAGGIGVGVRAASLVPLNQCKACLKEMPKDLETLIAEWCTNEQ